MKRTLFAFLFLLPVLLSAQFRIVGTGLFTTVNDSTYRAKIDFRPDLTGFSYNPTQMNNSMYVLSQRGQLYRLDSFYNATFSSAFIVVVEKNGNWGSPVGQVMVFQNNSSLAAPQAVYGANGATAGMQAGVDTWNALLLKVVADSASYWNEAYSAIVDSIWFSGTTTKTLNMVQRSGDTLSASFVITGGADSLYVAENTDTTLLTNGDTLDLTAYPTMPFDSITFITTAENTALEGELTYNNQSGTLVLGMAGGIEMPIGQGEAHIVRNSTGVTIQKGKVVYISGATGQRPQVSLADADTEIGSSVTFGITAEAIAANDSGFVFTSGYIKGINTNSLTEGEALWLDTIPGGFTHTKPTAPVNSVLVGYVITKKSNGTIFVKIQNGYEIDELHNVVTAGKVNNSVIRYDSATALWKASTTAGIVAGDTSVFVRQYQLSGNSGYLPKYTTDTTLGNSLFFDNGTQTMIGGTTPAYNLSRFSIYYNPVTTGPPILADTRAYNSAILPGGSWNIGGQYDSLGTYASFAAFAGKKENSNNLDTKGEAQIFVNDGTDIFPDEAIRVKSNGRVGIGTATPDARLNIINTNSTVPALNIVGNTNVNSVNYNAVNVDMSTVGVNGTYTGINVFQSASSDGSNIGYKTSVNARNSAYGVYSTATKIWPGGALLGEAVGVYGSATTTSGLGFSYGGKFENLATSGTGYGLYVNTTSAVSGSVTPFAVAHKGTVRTVIDTVGRVGIGTTSPVFKLSVLGADSCCGTPRISAQFRDGLNSAFYVAHTGPHPTPGYATLLGSSDDLAFGQIQSGGTSEYMRIKATTGRVGIGTTSPAHTLDISGETGITTNKINFASTNGGTGNPGSYISGEKLGNWGGRIDFYARDAAGALTKNIMSIEGSGGIGGGYVGIKTTTPARSLHINSTDAIRIPAGTNAQRILSGLGSAIGDLRYNTEDSVENIEWYDVTGAWRRPVISALPTGFGTAGRFAQFKAGGLDTSAVLIQSNGRIGIGTASPTEGLHVNGTARATRFAVNTFGSQVLNINNYAPSGSSGNNIWIGGGGQNATGSSSYNNIGIGDGVMVRAMTGRTNIAIGSFAMQENLTGISNIAIGDLAMNSNTSGSSNMSIGAESLRSVTSGSINTAVGYRALFSTTSGSSNVAFSYEAMYSNKTGEYNIAIGRAAMYSVDTSDNNVAIGGAAMYGLLGGDNNVAIGTDAGRYTPAGAANQQADNCVYIGTLSRTNTSGRTNEVVIGYNANGNGSNTTTIGNSSTTATYIPAGKLRIGNTTAPTATLHLPAGTASANTAPLKFTSGTNLTTPEAGAVEWNGTNLFVTNSSASRRTVNQGISSTLLLNFAAAGGQSSSDQKIALTGVEDGDVVSLGVPNAAVFDSTCYTAWAFKTDSIIIRFNNYSRTSKDPAQATFKVFVTKFNLMKHLIVLLLMFLQPLFVNAQELVKDSVWLTREAYETTDTNGRSTGLNWTFIRNTYFEFDDLSGRLDKLPIGDTVQARSALLGWQVDLVRQHSYHAVQAMKKAQVIGDWQQVNAAMKANGLGGLDEAMQAAFEGQLIGDAHVKIGTAVFVPADVVKNAAGNLRLIFSATGYRVILYADTMLRIVGYPAAGQNTDLYKVREKVFRSIDNTFTLRLR